MLWSDKRPQPPGEGALPDKLWAALLRRLSEVQRAEFERDREALKGKLETALDKLASAPATDFTLEGRDARSMQLVEWCHTQEFACFDRWARRVKFDWVAWQRNAEAA